MLLEISTPSALLIIQSFQVLCDDSCLPQITLKPQNYKSTLVQHSQVYIFSLHYLLDLHTNFYYDEHKTASFFKTAVLFLLGFN